MKTMRVDSVGFVSRFLLITPLLFLSTGCGTVTTHLQSVTVSGPLFEPVVHLNRATEDPSIRVTPWLNISTQRQRVGRLPGHTKVNLAGVYQVDSVAGAYGYSYYENPANIRTFDGQNLHWKLPPVSGGADVDLDLTERISVFFGAGMNAVGNEPLWSAHSGLSVGFESQKVTGRFEFALSWETVASTADFAQTFELSSSRTQVEFIHQESKRMRTGYYAALTIQTKAKGANFFAQLAVGTQPIASLIPSSGYVTEGQEEEYIRNMKFVSVTPGLSFRLDDDLRLLTGIRFTGDTDVSGTSTPFLITPLVQLEFSF